MPPSLSKITGFENAAKTFSAGYFGREWLESLLDDEIEASSGKHIVLIAPPGFGKTAFASHYAESRNLPRWYVRLGHHSGVLGLDPLRFASSIGEQIRQKYGIARQAGCRIRVEGSAAADIIKGASTISGARIDEILADDTDEIVISGNLKAGTVCDSDATGSDIGRIVTRSSLLSPEALIQREIIDTSLRVLDLMRDTKIVIVVDAVDEATCFSGSKSILDLIPEPQELPGNLQFVFTSRPGSHVSKLGAAKSIDLTRPRFRQNRRADTVGFAMTELAEVRNRDQLVSNPRQLAEELARWSDGNMMLLKLALPEVLKDPSRAMETLNRLPDSIAGFYELFLSSLFDQACKSGVPAWQDGFGRLLDILAVQQTELAASQIAEVSGIDSRVIGLLLRALSPILHSSRTPAGLTYGFFHSSVHQYLLEEHARIEFHVDRKKANSRFVEKLHKHRLNPANHYAMRFYSHHLVESGEQEALRDWFSLSRIQQKRELPLGRVYAHFDVREALRVNSSIPTQDKLLLWFQDTASSEPRADAVLPYEFAASVRSGFTQHASSALDYFQDDHRSILVLSESVAGSSATDEATLADLRSRILSRVGGCSSEMLDASAQTLAHRAPDLAILLADLLPSDVLAYPSHLLGPCAPHDLSNLWSLRADRPPYPRGEVPCKWGCFQRILEVNTDQLELLSGDPSGRVSCDADRSALRTLTACQSLASRDLDAARASIAAVAAEQDPAQFLSPLAFQVVLTCANDPAFGLRVLSAIGDVTGVTWAILIASDLLLSAAHVRNGVPSYEELLDSTSPLPADLYLVWQHRRGLGGADNRVESIRTASLRDFTCASVMQENLQANPVLVMRELCSEKGTVNEVDFSCLLAGLVSVDSPEIAESLLASQLKRLRPAVDSHEHIILGCTRILVAAADLGLRRPLVSAVARLVPSILEEHSTLSDAVLATAGKVVASYFEDCSSLNFDDFVAFASGPEWTTRSAEIFLDATIWSLRPETCVNLARTISNDQSSVFAGFTELPRVSETTLLPVSISSAVSAIALRAAVVDRHEALDLLHRSLETVSELSGTLWLEAALQPLFTAVTRLNPPGLQAVVDQFDLDDVRLRRMLSKALEEVHFSDSSASLTSLFRLRLQHGIVARQVTANVLFQRNRRTLAELHRAAVLKGGSSGNRGETRTRGSARWFEGFAEFLKSMDMDDTCARSVLREDSNKHVSRVRLWDEVIPALMEMPSPVGALASMDPLCSKWLLPRSGSMSNMADRMTGTSLYESTGILHEGWSSYAAHYIAHALYLDRIADLPSRYASLRARFLEIAQVKSQVKYLVTEAVRQLVAEFACIEPTSAASFIDSADMIQPSGMSPRQVLDLLRAVNEEIRPAAIERILLETKSSSWSFREVRCLTRLISASTGPQIPHDTLRAVAGWMDEARPNCRRLLQQFLLPYVEGLAAKDAASILCRFRVPVGIRWYNVWHSATEAEISAPVVIGLIGGRPANGDPRAREMLETVFASGRMQHDEGHLERLFEACLTMGEYRHCLSVVEALFSAENEKHKDLLSRLAAEVAREGETTALSLLEAVRTSLLPTEETERFAVSLGCELESLSEAGLENLCSQPSFMGRIRILAAASRLGYLNATYRARIESELLGIGQPDVSARITAADALRDALPDMAEDQLRRAIADIAVEEYQSGILLMAGLFRVLSSINRYPRRLQLNALAALQARADTYDFEARVAGAVRDSAVTVYGVLAESYWPLSRSRATQALRSALNHCYRSSQAPAGYGELARLIRESKRPAMRRAFHQFSMEYVRDHDDEGTAAALNSYVAGLVETRTLRELFGGDFHDSCPLPLIASDLLHAVAPVASDLHPPLRGVLEATEAVYEIRDSGWTPRLRERIWEAVWQIASVQESNSWGGYLELWLSTAENGDLERFLMEAAESEVDPRWICRDLLRAWLRSTGDWVSELARFIEQVERAFDE